MLKRITIALNIALSELYVSLKDIFKKKQNLQRARCILYCEDSNRGFIYQEKFFAQIIDSFRLVNFDEADVIYTIGPPGTRITNKNVFGDFISPTLLQAFSFMGATLIDIMTFGATKLRKKYLFIRYLHIIKKLNSKLIISIQPPYELIEASIAGNSVIYDIQHGDIAPGVPYYENMIRKNVELNFMVWDEITELMLCNHFKVCPSRIKTIGHPWLDLYRSLKERDDNFVKYQLSKSEMIFGYGESKRVLVTLQYGLDKLYPDDFDNEFLPKCLVEIMKKNENIVWCIRLHPVVSKIDRKLNEFTKLISSFENKKIIINHPHDLALPALLELTDLHITWHSSSVIEAINYGIPSLVLCTAPYNYGYNGSDSSLFLDKPYEQYQKTSLVYWASDERSKKADTIRKFIYTERNGNEQLRKYYEI